MSTTTTSSSRVTPAPWEPWSQLRHLGQVDFLAEHSPGCGPQMWIVNLLSWSWSKKSAVNPGVKTKVMGQYHSFKHIFLLQVVKRDTSRERKVCPVAPGIPGTRLWGATIVWKGDSSPSVCTSIKWQWCCLLWLLLLFVVGLSVDQGCGNIWDICRPSPHSSASGSGLLGGFRFQRLFSTCFYFSFPPIVRLFCLFCYRTNIWYEGTQLIVL